MSEKRFLYLVGKKLAGETGKPELEELDALMHANKELEQLYKSLFAGKVAYSNEDLLNAQQAYATHFVKMQLNKQFDTGTTKKGIMVVKGHKIRYAMMLAAIVVLMAGGYWIYSSYTKTGPVKNAAVAALSNKNEIATKKGSKTNVRLPDGTQVWLNADSKITYAENFQGTTREVQLTGEAFFDVMRDTTRPFIIHTQTIDIKVLGTAFNVRSYPDEKNTETALVRGTIEVTLIKQADKKIILKPKDKLSVANNSDAVTLNENDMVNNVNYNPPVMTLGRISFLQSDTSCSAETLWVNNKLAFDNEPFEMVASKIGRWYNKEVIIKNEALKNLRFSAVFEEESLEEVMEALRLTNSLFTYQVNNGQVIVTAKK